MQSARSSHPDPLVSRRLQPGDRVRLVSPASFPDRPWLDHCIAALQSWGLTVEVGPHALDEHGYMAGTDADRLADLNDAFRDPAVRAVITTVGGAGAYRIADGIDFDAVRADPKPLLGFSDITYLHLVLYQQCRLATVHGCLAGADALSTTRQLLMSTEPVVVYRDPSATSAVIEVPGHVAGPLLGGSLLATAGSIGAGLPDLDGAIVLLEAPRTIGLGQVDRQLTQLLRSGAFDGIAGVALGLVTGFDGYVDRGWTIVDVLRDRLCGLGVPVLGGLPIGHGGVGLDGGPDQHSVTLGASAVLDTTAGTLTVGTCVQ